jgi:hypothetical protein
MAGCVLHIAGLIFVLILAGSCLHAARALTHPRWEDYSYEPYDRSTDNRFHWLGDGQTVADKTPGGDSKS